jgi:flagellar hook-associated protein 1 FlgK
MSLIGALNVSKTALAVQQAAIQVTSNNIANAGNAEYTRQTSTLVPGKDQLLRPGVFLGTGIDLSAVSRQIDESLQARIRASISDEQAANVTQQWLGRVESLFNELSDQDLSSQLSAFFNSWSNLANKPQDVGLRQVVLQSGDTVAKWFQSLRNQLSGLQTDVDNRLAAQANDANSLAQQVADLNQQIVVAEGGSGGTANGLRDQRDSVLKKLSELMDIKTVQQSTGVIDVYVGSVPLVSGTTSRGVALRTETVDGELSAAVTIQEDDGAMQLSAGQLGSLSSVRAQIGGMIDQVDSLAANLIFELNKLHSAGQGLEGLSAVTGANQVDDATVALNDSGSGLKFSPTHGSFVVHVRNKSTGLTTSTLVQVDLDGSGGNDTTLNSLVSALDGIADISASNLGGKLRLQADSSDVQISFSQDSSGALAALGVNSFFTGSDASSIALHQTLKEQPHLLAAAKNGEEGDNQTALAIAALESQSLAALNGASLKDSYQATIDGLATTAAAARNDADATRIVRETLEAQREGLSGVSLDEEAINLMRQQRAYQGAARVIAAVDELMNAILQLI